MVLLCSVDLGHSFQMWFAICKLQFISLAIMGGLHLWAEEKNDQMKKLAFLL